MPVSAHLINECHRTLENLQKSVILQVSRGQTHLCPRPGVGRIHLGPQHSIPATITVSEYRIANWRERSGPTHMLGGRSEEARLVRSGLRQMLRLSSRATAHRLSNPATTQTQNQDYKIAHSNTHLIHELQKQGNDVAMNTYKQRYMN